MVNDIDRVAETRKESRESNFPSLTPIVKFIEKLEN